MHRHVLKLISLLTALIIWVYVLSTAHIQIEKTVPINYSLPEGMSLASVVQKEVTYILDTPKAFIRTLLDRKDSIEVDLTKIKPQKNRPNQYAIDFQTSDIKLPMGVSVVQVVPKRVFIDLEKTVEKKIPLKPEFIKDLPEGRELVHFHLRPDSVKVSGPASAVKNLNAIKTKAMDRSQWNESGQKAIALEVPDPRFSLATQEVLFIYDIKSTQYNMRLNNIPISFHGTGLVKRANHRFVTLYVMGRKAELTDEQRRGVKVVAQYRSSKEEQRIKLEVELPAGIQLLKVVPDSVVVYAE